MNGKDFIDTLLARHSIREFTGDTINDDDIELIARAGMAAPSAVNVQPWGFIIVRDRKKLMSLRGGLPYAKMLDKAAAAIIVCGVTDKDAAFACKYWPLDCSAATENILLASHALGYGAVWTAVYPEEDRIAFVRAECGIPSSVVPLCVIPIGVPANKNAKPIDKFDASNIHAETW